MSLFAWTWLCEWEEVVCVRARACVCMLNSLNLCMYLSHMLPIASISYWLSSVDGLLSWLKFLFLLPVVLPTFRGRINVYGTTTISTLVAGISSYTGHTSETWHIYILTLWKQIRKQANYFLPSRVFQISKSKRKLVSQPFFAHCFPVILEKEKKPDSPKKRRKKSVLPKS